VIVPSPTQCEAVRQWLIAALNTDDAGLALDPAPFEAEAVFPGERDGPRERQRWARINTIALVSRGLCRSREGTGDDLLERRAEHREWTTSITVCSRLDPTARTLADEAAQHLQRALGAREGVATVALRAVGVSYLRGSDVQDTSRVRSGSEWETRATATVVWLCGWTATTPTPPVERVTGTGEVNSEGPLAFDSEDGAP
jgi:hypothetical protein